MSYRKRLGVAAVIVVTVITGGVVAALWTATGSGSGRATAVSAQTITATAATGTADLYPGFTEGDLHLNVTNPNPYDVTFTSFAVSAITSSDETGCAAATYLSIDTASAISLSVAAGASALAASIDDVVTLDSTAPDECQGAQFSVTLTLSGAQS